MAAIAVVAGHARLFIFVDFPGSSYSSALGKAFYWATGLGHQAVVVFFVLSGFLVGGQVCTAVAEDRWSWPRYLALRLARLWIVLLPALALTAFWDRLGWALTRSPLYIGGLGGAYHSTPGLPNNHLLSSPMTLVANALFLQTTDVLGSGPIPTFGTNGPLWSLANEFWYYMLFPLLWIALSARRRTIPARVLMLAAAALIGVALPAMMTLSGLIWLLGVAAFVLRNQDLGAARPSLCGLSAVALGVALVVARARAPNMTSDLLVGVSFAALLASRARGGGPAGLLATIWRRLANCSYTLYLTHFPLAAFLSCWLLHNRRLELTPSSLALFAAAMAVLVLYAYGIALLFESRTRALQACLIGQLEGASPALAAEAASGDRR